VSQIRLFLRLCLTPEAARAERKKLRADSQPVLT
jgi:hypothetical protein